jgi:hypothetical protein
MKNEKAKKLTLHRTMIRNLTTEDLSKVAGGTSTEMSGGCIDLNPQPLPP